jgi:hypothetical protein
MLLMMNCSLEKDVGAGVIKIELLAVLLLELLLDAVSTTLKLPPLENVCVGFTSVELVPSPNDHKYVLAFFDVLVNLTKVGALELVISTVKDAEGSALVFFLQAL